MGIQFPRGIAIFYLLYLDKVFCLFVSWIFLYSWVASLNLNLNINSKSSPSWIRRFKVMLAYLLLFLACISDILLAKNSLTMSMVGKQQRLLLNLQQMPNKLSMVFGIMTQCSQCSSHNASLSHVIGYIVSFGEFNSSVPL